MCFVYLAAAMLSVTPVPVLTNRPLPPRGSAALHGRVVNENQVPVPGAQLRLIPIDGDAQDARVATTDSLGSFRWDGLTGGQYRLSVRRLGFEPIDVAIELADGVDRQVSITLRAAAARLDTVTIHAASVVPGPSGRSSQMDEFYRRQSRGIGHFITSEDIKDHSPATLSSLLQRVSGVTAITNSDGTLTVGSAACRGVVGSGSGSDTWGSVALYVDGVQVSARERASVAGAITPEELEGIEVYRSPTELPAEAVGNACAAIYLWTRRQADADSTGHRGPLPHSAPAQRERRR